MIWALKLIMTLVKIRKTRMMFQEQIDLLQQKGLYRSLKSVGYIDRQYIEVENKRCTNYTSNDYLGLGQIAFK